MAEFKDFLPDDDEQMLVCGQSGSGKTTLIREFIALLEKTELVIVIDSKPDWEGLAPMFARKLKKGQARKLNPKYLWALAGEGAKGTYVYQTQDDRPAYDDPWVSIIIYWAIRRSTRLKKRGKKPGLTVVIDEMGDFAKGTYTSPSVSKLIRQGRSKRIRRIIGSQRPAGIPQLAIDQAQRFCVFMLLNKNDRKRFVDWVHPELARMADGHNFWYYEIPRGRPRRPLTYIRQGEQHG